MTDSVPKATAQEGARRYDAPAVSTIHLVTLDIKQVIDIAKNVHQLGMPFDHGGEISVYEMEVGTILSRSSFDLSGGIPAHFPVIFRRTKDSCEDWEDE